MGCSKLLLGQESVSKGGVEITPLDAAIQDAIMTSRGPGIQHLWIDAFPVSIASRVIYLAKTTWRSTMGSTG